MNIIQNRRDRLKAWFAGSPLPERERSYLSQLITGKSSFGEKAARRIEADYRMPAGYLDEPQDGEDALSGGEKHVERPIVLDDYERQLITFYRSFPDSTKQEMLVLFAEKSKEFERLFDELLKLRNSKK